jgi:hypothetical protein
VLIALFGLLAAPGLGCGEDEEEDPCSCDVREGSGRIALECVCADGTCTSLQEYADACTAYGEQIVQRGCGKISVSFDGVFTSSSSVYDEASGALIGTSFFTDNSVEGVCGTNDTVAGEAFDCPTATPCVLCPHLDESADIPLCPLPPS